MNQSGVDCIVILPLKGQGVLLLGLEPHGAPNIPGESLEAKNARCALVKAKSFLKLVRPIVGTHSHTTLKLSVHERFFFGKNHSSPLVPSLPQSLAIFWEGALTFFLVLPRRFFFLLVQSQFFFPVTGLRVPRHTDHQGYVPKGKSQLVTLPREGGSKIRVQYESPGCNDQVGGPNPFL
jgi:hypothetical protein